MRVNIQLTNVSFAHGDAGLKKGDKYQAVIKPNGEAEKQKAVFQIKGIEHHAWIPTNAAAPLTDGLTYAKILD